MTFEVAGMPEPCGGLHILGDFVFGGQVDQGGAFMFERAGVLAGIEVYGLALEAPGTLPDPCSLRPFHDEKAHGWSAEVLRLRGLTRNAADKRGLAGAR